MCVRAFGTSPTLALNILSKQIPVDYRIMELAVNSQIRMLPENVARSTAKSVAGFTNLLPKISTNVPSAIFFPTHHPWYHKDMPKLVRVHESVTDRSLSLPLVAASSNSSSMELRSPLLCG